MITEHFKLDEFIRSSTASARGIDNSPNDEQLANIKHTAQQMEKVRALLGNKPILISSGFRSDALNMAVGGSKTSSHSQGFAVDFTCHKFGDVKKVCKTLAESGLRFDQIIYEQGATKWCHIGFGSRMRRERLSWKRGKGYVSGIVDL